MGRNQFAVLALLGVIIIGIGLLMVRRQAEESGRRQADEIRERIDREVYGR